MYRVEYYREDAMIHDARYFRNLEELNQWLKGMFKLKEHYYITLIEKE